MDQHYPLARSVIEFESRLFSLVQLQAARRAFEVPFIFPTTGTGHVLCYPCCLVPNSRFVQGFMPEYPSVVI